jgi:hypothetical protein
MSLRRFTFVVVATSSAVALSLPLAHASERVQPTSSVPQITGVARQDLAYSFATYARDVPLPDLPGIVDVTLIVSGAPQTGSYATCLTAVDANRDTTPYVPLTKGPTLLVRGLMPSRDYWCSVTSSPVPAPDRWSLPVKITTAAPAAEARLHMTADVYAAVVTPVYGPVCSGCRDTANTSWRWPLTKRWEVGKALELPGGINLPLPLKTDVGLQTWLAAATDGTPVIRVGTGIGPVDLITTTDLKVTPTGFEATALLTSNAALLAYLPELTLQPGQVMGTLEVEQRTVPIGPTIQVTCEGTAAGSTRSVTCSGTTTGLPKGTRLTPYARSTARDTWTPIRGAQRPTVSDGSFTWTFAIPRGWKFYSPSKRWINMYFQTGKTKSNRETVTFPSASG